MATRREPSHSAQAGSPAAGALAAKVNTSVAGAGRDAVTTARLPDVPARLKAPPVSAESPATAVEAVTKVLALV